MAIKFAKVQLFNDHIAAVPADLAESDRYAIPSAGPVVNEQPGGTHVMLMPSGPSSLLIASPSFRQKARCAATMSTGGRRLVYSIHACPGAVPSWNLTRYIEASL